VYVFSPSASISLSLNHRDDVSFGKNNEFKVSNTYLK